LEFRKAIFENQEALLDEIAKDKSKFGIPQTLKLYKARYLPSKKICRLIYFHCCYCEARIYCRVIKGGCEGYRPQAPSHGREIHLELRKKFIVSISLRKINNGVIENCPN